jgi:hypothetical protein
MEFSVTTARLKQSAPDLRFARGEQLAPEDLSPPGERLRLYSDPSPPRMAHASESCMAASKKISSCGYSLFRLSVHNLPNLSVAGFGCLG